MFSGMQTLLTDFIPAAAASSPMGSMLHTYTHTHTHTY
jgi:hypothetical protein